MTSDVTGRPSQSCAPRIAVYALAALFASALAGDLLWMPIQVSDSAGELLDAQRAPSAWTSFVEQFRTVAYLRPARIAQIKLLFDGAGGTDYWLVFRGFHAALAVAALVLFTRALGVTTVVDIGAAAFALVVFVGLHTFRGTVQESFPINHFLEIVVFSLLTLNLARSRGGWTVDIVAGLTFVVAAFTLESGLLVWVVAATAWGVGWRGISGRGLAIMTALLIGYGVVRFGVLSTGVPALTERSSGYLLQMLDPEEIERRFGQQPYWFYAYNVASSIGSVLLSEPQGGMFETARAWMNDTPRLRVVLPVATSVLTTALLFAVGWQRLRHRRPFDDTSRLLVLLGTVLAGSALLSFTYTKDEIMSTAGAFYALAAFGAMRAILPRVALLRGAARMAGALLIVLLASGWAVRAAGVHYVLRSQAVKHQLDWVNVPPGWNAGRERSLTGDERRLLDRLREEAIHIEVPDVRVTRARWMNSLWTD